VIFLPKVFAVREQNDPMAGIFRVIGRLKDGVTREQTAAELNVIMIQMADEKILRNFELRVIVKPLKEMVRDSRRGLLVILGAIGTLLLVACVNLGILGLVRAERRGLESDVQGTLGASRTQLLRQALVETILVAFPGAALGMAVASSGVDILIRITPANIPRLSEVRIGGHVLLFALTLTGITTILSGVLPAWRTAEGKVERVLKAGGRTATSDAFGFRLRNGLVATEVGLGVMLLVTAGLLLKSFARIMHADRGFQAPAVLAIDIPLPPEENQAVDFYDCLLEHLASAAGVESAAIVNALPLEGEQWVNPVWVPGDTRPEWERPLANVRIVSPGYFQTMGIPVIEGRTFDQTNRSREVVVISQRLAQALQSEQDTVAGRRVMEQDPEWEIIGVVKDVRARADRDAAAMLYHPHWFTNQRNIIVVARARNDPLSIVGSVRAAVHDTDADAPVAAIRTMRQVLEESVSQRRFQMLLTSTFALCALLLARLDVYGVVPYAAARRTRDMGIRLAFGARPSDVYHTVLGRGMVPVILGLLVGVTGACAQGRLRRSLLYQTSPCDPLTIVSVVSIMSLVTSMACFIPARRAANVNPTDVLRYK
jgi:predicted permease